MNAHKVLLVDDDSDMRHSIFLLLRPFCQIFEAPDGPKALAIIKEERPRLMLLDYSMPDMTGVEVLKAAREIDPDIIVIMLTSQTEFTVIKRAMDLGANQYLTKPFDIDYLRNEVRRLLGIKNGENGGADGRPWRVVS